MASLETIAFVFFLTVSWRGTRGQAPVEYEPEFLEALENHTVTQGRDVIFTCVVNHLGPYKVAWIKSDSKAILAIHTHLVAHNNRLSVTHNGHNTWKLKVSNVQKNDSGTYMCQINTDPMRSQMGMLEVVVPPDILNEDNQDDYVAVEGGSVRLKCKATGIPEAKVTWKREDARNIVLRHETGTKEGTELLLKLKMVSKGRKMFYENRKQETTEIVVRSFEGETLQLNNVQRTDMGSYLCIATNGVPPSVSKRFIVQIHFHPAVKVSNQLVAAPMGSDVLIQCYVETSPKAMHSWYKDTGEKLMDGNKYEMEEIAINEYSLFMNLTIRSLEKRDFGGYICSSVNAMGKAEGVIRLQELHIPKTTILPVANVNEHHRGNRKKQAVHSKERGSQQPGQQSGQQQEPQQGQQQQQQSRRKKKPSRGGSAEEEDGGGTVQPGDSLPPRVMAPTSPRPPPWVLHHNELSGGRNVGPHVAITSFVGVLTAALYLAR